MSGSFARAELAPPALAGVALAALASLASTGCPKTAPDPLELAQNGGPRAPSGPLTCETSVACGPGERCQGTQGCELPWICAPEQPCTKDVVLYCGCDGEPFRASSTCPDRPFSRRGACDPCDDPL